MQANDTLFDTEQDEMAMDLERDLDPLLKSIAFNLAEGHSDAFHEHRDTIRKHCDLAEVVMSADTVAVVVMDVAEKYGIGIETLHDGLEKK